MTKKQKEIEKIIKSFAGKDLDIYVNNMEARYGWGNLSDFSGTYLTFENFHHWNGTIEKEKTIHSGSIKKLEFKK